MEPKDYINQILEQWASTYVDTQNNSLKDQMSTVDSHSIFTSQSISDFFNEINTYQPYDLSKFEDDINPSEPNETTTPKMTTVELTETANLIGSTADLINKHGYTSTQCIVIHNRHYEKIQKLLHDFYKITITEDPEKSNYERFIETLIFLNASFKTNQNAVLTKAGMERCNDIYNWYEGIKRHINEFGAERT